MGCLRRFLGLSILLWIFQSPAFAEEVWQIVVDEWPPFSCSKCPEGGAGVKATREALASAGIKAEFVFYSSWVQVVKHLKSKKFSGYFSWEETLESGYFLPTAALFTSPVIVLEPRRSPLQWKTFLDFKGKRVGIMEGAGYDHEFVKLTKQGVISPLLFNSDLTRVRLIAQGKLDAAFMDKYTALYYLSQLSEAERDEVRINERTIGEKKTYLALQERHRSKLPQIEKALQTINTQKVVEDYIKKTTGL